MVRTGCGYDVHRLVSGRDLWLGGVLIPSEYGLSGHSDADVLLHAITDAILGSMALGDIGVHFPDTDPQFKDAGSEFFLREANRLVTEKGFRICNIDATVVIERPRLRDHIDEIRVRIAFLLDIPVSAVSVKATTSEGLGFIGRREGAAANAVCSVTDDKN